MRHIGSLETESHARSLYSYLVTQKIRCMVEEEDGQWAVWIYDEDQVEQARTELADFRSEPEASKYAAAVREAAKLKREQQKQAKVAQKRQVNVRDQWQQPLTSRAPVTVALLAISILACVLLSDFQGPWGRGLLSFGPRLCNRPQADYLLVSQVDSSLPEIRSGQIWRIFTPMFLHFSVLHILFNMMWTRDLGSAIEARIGSWRFLALVLFCGACSILLACQLEGPFAGGMSGVLFGLFGYVYVKGRFQPELGLGISSNLVFLLVMWLALGFSGTIGNISNWGHVFGMLGGAVFAYAPIGIRKVLGPRKVE
jgi:GlpG protein